MSLNVSLEQAVTRNEAVFSSNITHNLGEMATAAGIYDCLWYPEKLSITKASELIEPLRAGLAVLQSDPARFRKLDDPNNWGTYEDLLAFVENYLQACELNPQASVRACR